MRSNVFITARSRGKIVTKRDGHNVWVVRGNKFLAELISYSVIGPDAPERNDRVRYMGVGIGGKNQNLPTIANSPPISTAYPVGHDPNATTGRSYDENFPINPMISTLERPVRITGGSTPYPGALSDVWLLDTPNLYITHTTQYDFTVHGILNGAVGQVVYSPFTYMPLSEVGLFTTEVSVSKNIPYSTLMAYFAFDTIMLADNIDLEFVWSVRF